MSYVSARDSNEVSMVFNEFVGRTIFIPVSFHVSHYRKFRNRAMRKSSKKRKSKIIRLTLLLSDTQSITQDYEVKELSFLPIFERRDNEETEIGFQLQVSFPGGVQLILEVSLVDFRAWLYPAQWNSELWKPKGGTYVPPFNILTFLAYYQYVFISYAIMKNLQKWIVLFITLWLLSACTQNSDSWLQQTTSSDIQTQDIDPLEPPTQILANTDKNWILSQQDVIVSRWIDWLDVPWELAFIDDTTALVTQRWGTINKIINWELQEQPYWEAPSIERGEWGLMWLAIHPDYEENGYIYAMYTYRKDFSLATANKVVRLQENSDSKLKIERTILDDIPAKLYHNGGRIHFGPDNKLYITTWDASNPEISQDLDSLWGKILRLNDDGTIPEDNPFPDSPVYSLGHRNPQGIAWNESWDLFMSTHWPSWEFGLRAKDRVDHIIAWTDYGWPTAYGPDQWYPNPIAYWPDEATPPGGMAFWNGSLYLATLKSAALLKLDIEFLWDWYLLTSEERWFEWEYGRLRDVTVWPDWNLYVLTSNWDGRSWGIGWDDVILKIEVK